MKLLTSTVIAAAMLTMAHAASAASHSGSSGNGMDTTTNSGTSANTSRSFDSSWNAQNSYWRSQYPSTSYYSSSRDYSLYEPAYRYGVDLYNRNPGKSYDQLNPSEVSRGWNSARGSSGLNWSDAQMATRDAYNRMYQNRNANGSATSGSTAAGSSGNTAR